MYATQGTTAEIDSSTFSNNMTIGRGAGIRAAFNANLILTNSTMSGNSAGVSGGGINATFDASVSLTNSTLSENLASSSGGGVNASSATITLKNALLSGNRAPAGAEMNTSDGAIVNSRNSLLGDSSLTSTQAYVGFISSTTDIVATSDFLGLGTHVPTSLPDILLPLENNGGDTRTHGLNESSPARGLASTTDCPAVDQRGQLRDDGDGKCDIGAVEFNVSDLPVEEASFFVVPIGNGKSVIFSL